MNDVAYVEGQVSTAQKGPMDVEGVVVYMQPEEAKISIFEMEGILSLHRHKFWLKLDAP